MKNKFLLYIAILLMAQLSTDARTPRLSRKGFTYETMKLPAQKLPAHRTYSIYIESAADYGPVAMQATRAVELRGWSLTDNNPEYTVELVFQPVFFDRPRIIERCELVKDTAGRVVDTLYFYRNVYRARGNAILDVMNSARQIMLSTTLPQACRNFTGREFKSRRAARKFSRREGMQAHLDMMRQFAREFSLKANSILDDQFGIYPIQKRDQLLIVRNKKHSEFSRMQLLWNSFNNVSDIVHINADLNAVENKLDREISYLKGIDRKFKGRSKAHRKIRHIAYVNLSKIYLMLDRPQDALHFGQKARNNGFRNSEANQMIAQAKHLSRMLNLHS